MGFIRAFLIAGGVLGLVSCAVSGPKNSGTMEAAERRLSGRVVCGDGALSPPAAHARVELKKDFKVVGSVSAGSDGRYVLSASIDPKASYILSAVAACGNGSRALPAGLPGDLREQNLSLFK